MAELVNFSILEGLVLESFKEDSEQILIEASGRKFAMYHTQSCCESVTVDSVNVIGSIGAMIGEKITDAVEETNSTDDALDKHATSWTWTYYTLRTHNGTITIRWYGTSNGYYSESVNTYEIKPWKQEGVKRGYGQPHPIGGGKIP